MMLSPHQFRPGQSLFGGGVPGAPSDTPANPHRGAGVQMTLPGTPEELLPRPQMPQEDEAPTPENPVDALADYGSAHDSSWGAGAWGDNPLYDPDVDYWVGDYSNSQYREGRVLDRSGRTEFVPSWKISSSQPGVNERAIQHQVDNANPLALDKDPEVMEFQKPSGEVEYALGDGNHRVNAAQRRGQLLVPARVERYVDPARRVPPRT